MIFQKLLRRVASTTVFAIQTIYPQEKEIKKTPTLQTGTLIVDNQEHESSNLQQQNLDQLIDQNTENITKQENPEINQQTLETETTITEPLVSVSPHIMPEAIQASVNMTTDINVAQKNINNPEQKTELI